MSLFLEWKAKVLSSSEKYSALVKLSGCLQLNFTGPQRTYRERDKNYKMLTIVEFKWRVYKYLFHSFFIFL